MDDIPLAGKNCGVAAEGGEDNRPAADQSHGASAVGEWSELPQTSLLSGARAENTNGKLV